MRTRTALARLQAAHETAVQGTRRAAGHVATKLQRAQEADTRAQYAEQLCTR